MTTAVKKTAKTRKTKKPTETDRFVKENREVGAEYFGSAYADTIGMFPDDGDFAFDEARTRLAVTITRIVCDPENGWDSDIDTIYAADAIIGWHLKKYTKARFWAAYKRLSESGKCDCEGGMECRRVFREWKEAGCPEDLDAFIYVAANTMPPVFYVRNPKVDLKTEVDFIDKQIDRAAAAKHPKLVAELTESKERLIAADAKLQAEKAVVA